MKLPLSFAPSAAALLRLLPVTPGCLLLGLVCLTGHPLHGQDASPTPTPASTPVVDPGATPDPTASPTSPSSPADSPTPAPGTSPMPGGPLDFTDPNVVAAYYAARTPQVSVTVAATASSFTSSVPGSLASRLAAAQNAAQTLQPTVQNGVATLVRLPSPTRTTAKTVGSSATASTGTSSQPANAVILTYAPACAGQLVWVQMLRGGTLTASDGAGHTYDGSGGFYLQLDANGMAAFNYQAPNASGTYQILTRFSNVTTTLPFLVPDATP